MAARRGYTCALERDPEEGPDPIDLDVSSQWISHTEAGRHRAGAVASRQYTGRSNEVT